jgi:hypothetical protein
MEHIDGRDLEGGLSRADDVGRPVAGAPYPAADVARWGAALCGVLEYLHARRPQPVLHQDIKPANLVLDQHSGALFLVDFGTAHAHTGAPTGGYGTPGYAPPEQYRGQSQPRSDVYALAATLYHLASDDDPAQHPFSFPQLDALGGLGDALRPALATDPAARPHAHELRRSLEALAHPGLARTLAAPDGDALYDERQVARWCEQNWRRAAPWLRTRALPDELERCLAMPALARGLRDAIAQHPADDQAALDAALALLDPRGYGAARPLITIDPDMMVLKLRGGALVATEIAVQNRSRRYVRARVLGPRWLAVEVPAEAQAPGYSRRFPSLSLAPGQSAALLLAGAPPRGTFGGNASEQLELREEDPAGGATGTLLASASLKAARRPWPIQGVALWLTLLLPLLVLATCVVGVSRPRPLAPTAVMIKPPFEPLVAGDYPLPPTLSPAYPPPAHAYPLPPYAGQAEAVYQNALTAFEEGGLQAAQLHLDDLRETLRAYSDGDAVLYEAYYQMARRAYAAKQWAKMPLPLYELHRLAPGYKDSAYLLKEAFYRPAKIEFERGDYARAQAALREVWQLDPDYLDAKLLLAQCYMHLADEALAQNRLNDALRWIEALDRLRPDFPELPRLRTALAAAQIKPLPSPAVP